MKLFFGSLEMGSGKMEFHLAADPKLSFYTKGGSQIYGEKYSLLGFKENMAVLTPINCEPPDEPRKTKKIFVNCLKKLPPMDLSKLLVDETGDKFINLNGQKLKIVPQNKIPEAVRKRTLLLKQQLEVNIANGNLKKPLPIGVIRTHVNNADTFRLVKSADKVLTTTHKDKPINIHGLKKIKLITTKLQKPPFSNQDIHTETTNLLSASSVIPTICPDEPISNINQHRSRGRRPSDSVWWDPECLMPVANTREKLLSEKNLQILNRVKMHASVQALNLSLKKIQDTAIMQANDIKMLVEIGIQTDTKIDVKKKVFTDQIVQTDIQRNCHQNFDLFDLMDFDNFLDMAMDPVLTDVNLSSGKFGGKSLTAESSGKSLQLSGCEPNNVSGKQVQDVTIKKRLMFFRDLRECLVHNASGNLPIHEGVINNDVGLVKRHCIALKARKAGVNLENHNGCNPLQLAIIHDAHVDIVQTLLDSGADIREPDGEGNTILHLGAKFERQKVLEVILSHKSFNYCFDCMNSFNFEGLTPLMICCISSWTAGANLFMNRGANVNLRDQTSGRTALFHAAEAQDVEIVRSLLNHKADPKVKNFFGTSPHDAMYELDDMSETIKSLIFGRSKKRTIEAEMNPVRTAKAAKNLKTFSRLQRIEQKGGVPITAPPIRYKLQRQIK